MATYSLMDDGNAINSGGVAVFIAKVWRIVEDAEYQHLISWSEVSISLRARGVALARNYS